jgi:hypothetical protein
MRAIVRAITLALVIGALVLLTPVAGASVWTNGAGDFSWSNPLNWDGGVPDSVDAVADFSRLDIPGDTTVNLNGNKTAGTMIFGDTVRPFPPGIPPGPAHNWIVADYKMLRYRRRCRIRFRRISARTWRRRSRRCRSPRRCCWWRGRWGYACVVAVHRRVAVDMDEFCPLCG